MPKILPIYYPRNPTQYPLWNIPYMRASKRIIAAFLLLVLTSLSGYGYADETGGIDVILLMDSSGSMKKTDPMTLRIPAARLFLSLLGKHDRASVVSFSDKGYPLIPLIKIDGNDKRLCNAVGRISSRGMHTNIHDALLKGLDVLRANWLRDRKKIIVLMSDGKMDVGDPAKDEQLVQQIQQELVPGLRERQIRIYTIAFSEFSDRALLREIAERTDGSFNLALKDRDLHKIFSSIFENVKRPEMLPIEGGSFLVDPSIQEVTIVATKGKPDAKIMLQSPDGRKYSSFQSTGDMKWFVSREFVMVTVKKPIPGTWELLFSADKGNKVYIISDLHLKTNFDQVNIPLDEPVNFDVWLEKDGAVLKEKLILEGVDLFAEVGEAGSESVIMKLGYRGNKGDRHKNDGHFSFQYIPRSAGQVEIRIVAKGKTFEREKVFHLNIIGPEKEKEVHDKTKMNSSNQVMEGQHHDEKQVEWERVLMQFAILNLIVAVGFLFYVKRGIFMKGLRLRPADNHEEESEEKEEDNDQD